MVWSEGAIGSVLARNIFKDGLVMVPNCNFTGHECDLLVVTKKLMLVDVEIKISRADLKADAAKAKWWQTWEAVGDRYRRRDEPLHVTWPPKVFMHYYAMPRAIWRPDLLDFLGSDASGVILLDEPRQSHLPPDYTVERKARKNPDAQPISPPALMDIARLASLRMWDSFKATDEAIARARLLWDRAASNPSEDIFDAKS